MAYEIGLSDDNAQQLRGQLSEWTSKARRVGGRRNIGTRPAGSTSDAGKIREWARENGHEVSERGRVAKEIREAYNAAH